MELKEILAHCDHTLLKPQTTLAQIKTLCDQAIRYGCASVCIPPSYIAEAKAYVGDRLPLCTVVGFPNGYHTTEVKVFEAGNAIANGADEIDIVVNLGWVKDGRWGDILGELEAVRAVCGGRILKVIIEICLLEKEEKTKLCRLVSEAGADYIKTSTGFSAYGATFADVELLRGNVDAAVAVKAAGSISSIEDAEKYLRLGAERLGTSRLVAFAEALEKQAGP